MFNRGKFGGVEGKQYFTRISVKFNKKGFLALLDGAIEPIPFIFSFRLNMSGGSNGDKLINCVSSLT